MKVLFRSLLLTLLLTPSLLFAQDPTRFQGEVDAIVNKEFSTDENKPIVVFTGSSSVRMWTDIQKTYPSINVINTGFGGSQTSDLLYYKNELILNYKPDKVFIYEGDNDIAEGKTRITIIPEMKDLGESILKEYPEAEIYFISPKPSIARWNFKEEYETLNTMMEIMFRYTEGFNFIDVWNPMLNEQGEPMDDIFIEDNLHMNAKGYKIWEEVIRPYIN